MYMKPCKERTAVNAVLTASGAKENIQMNNIKRRRFLIPLLVACGQKAEHTNEIC